MLTELVRLMVRICDLSIGTSSLSVGHSVPAVYRLFVQPVIKIDLHHKTSRSATLQPVYDAFRIIPPQARFVTAVLGL